MSTPMSTIEARLAELGVTLPNAFNETQAFARDIKALSTGIIWYRKHITLPADATRGRAFLEFEGVRQAAEIWVNGRSVALSEHGVMAFGADITAALKPGDNVIAVRVDNDWKYKERATGSALFASGLADEADRGLGTIGQAAGGGVDARLQLQQRLRPCQQDR